MLSVDDIRERFVTSAYVFSQHALKRMVERNISRELIEIAGRSAEIIEDYPNDKYLPSCLIHGIIDESDRLHMQVTRDESMTMKVITLYRPDPAEWSNDFRQRRRL